MGLLTNAPRILAAVSAADAVACAIPLQYIKNDLDRLGCPEALQKAIPGIKAAAATGLVVGEKNPKFGRMTSVALVAYFGIAIGVHVRAGDKPTQSAPAAGLVVLSALSAYNFHQQVASAR